MAITTTEVRKLSFGNRKGIIGKSVLSGGSSSGDVAVAMQTVDILLPITSAAAEKGIAVNEAFPLSNNTGTGCKVTTVCETADSTFYWLAIGW